MTTIKFPRNPRLPDFSFGWVRAVLLILALAFVAWTAFYTVPAEAEGVVLRLGRFSHVVPSGLHFKLPLGVDRARIVPVKRQLKQEFGFGTVGATNPGQSELK